MAEIAGRGGQLDFSSSQITGLKSWSLTHSLDMLDTTDFDNGQATNSPRVFTPGLSTWSGTFEGFKDGVPLTLSYTSGAAIKLYESQTASQFWTGTAFITEVSETTAVDGTVDVTYAFQGTGELTEPAA